jgi:hypothetical protein
MKTMAIHFLEIKIETNNRAKLFKKRGGWLMATLFIFTLSFSYKRPA